MCATLRNFEWDATLFIHIVLLLLFQLTFFLRNYFAVSVFTIYLFVVGRERCFWHAAYRRIDFEKLQWTSHPERLRDILWSQVRITHSWGKSSAVFSCRLFKVAHGEVILQMIFYYLFTAVSGSRGTRDDDSASEVLRASEMQNRSRAKGSKWSGLTQVRVGPPESTAAAAASRGCNHRLTRRAAQERR